MFVFILEVLDGDGPKPGSFWEVPKKRRHRPTLPKKPDEKPVASPSASEALVDSLLASTSPAVPEPSGHEMMTGVKPSAPIDPPPPFPTPGPPVPPTTPARTAPREEMLAELLALVPFPREFAHSGIVSWGHGYQQWGFSFDRVTLAWIVNKARYTGDHAQRIFAAIPFLIRPP